MDLIKQYTLSAVAFIVTTSAVASGQPIDVWSRPVRAERSHDFDALHYDISLELSSSTRSYAGETTVTLRPLRSGFDSCALDAETFDVTGVRNSLGQPLRFRQEPGRLVVFFPRPYGYGETLSFAVSYIADSVDVDEERFGMSKGYEVGLGFVPANARRSEIINSLSFPTGARHWFPCYDHPNDKATTEVRATVDERYSVLSNGDLLSVKHDERQKTKTWHWSMSRPHSTYLTVLVAGEYVMLEDSLGPLPVRYWVYRADEQNGRRTFGRTPEILAFFNRLFGVDYPWSKYDQITIPGIGGGAESTTATLIGETAVVDERAQLDWPADWLVAHEAAHQWWGDYVTMRDWSHTWLNESFATYYECVWREHADGEDEGAWILENKRRQYYREAKTKYRRPIVFNRWEWPNQNFDSHTYPKGAAVLRMLRADLGGAGFDASIRHFLRSHPYGSVDTHDLLVSIREATGRVMDPFFDQWVYGAGHPELDVFWTWEERSRMLQLSVRQVQTVDEHVSLFRFPVDIGVQTPGGYSVTRVEVSQGEEIFEIPAIERPLFVRFDDGNTLLAEVKYTCTLDEDLVHLTDGDAHARRTAIERLRSSIANRRVREALMLAGTKDRFWRVRALALDALGETAWDGAKSYFQERYSDTSSGVRAAAVRALGKSGATSIVRFLLAAFEIEKSYLVQSEIVRAVGRLDGAGNREFLERARTMPSHRSLIRNAAEAVLSAEER